MDAIELLTTDHQKVRTLFGQFQTAQEAEDENRMAQLASTIFEELEVHTTIEEEIFYPAIRDEDEELSETVDESLQEHHVVDVLMNEMRDLTDGSDEWVAKMTVLIENVEHHADEEEQEMFPDVREQLSADRLRELGDQMASRKETAKAELTTKADLYEKAKELDVEGRSEMSKDELAEAVAKAS
jgi:iron-sulfur cluster repair protein YtfE (RIC family)